jgi:hypothetical protein
VQRCFAVILVMSAITVETPASVETTNSVANPGDAAQADHGDLITLPELAKILKQSPGTIYDKIGRLGQEDGVLRIGCNCTRINKTLFLARLNDANSLIHSGRTT